MLGLLDKARKLRDTLGLSGDGRRSLPSTRTPALRGRSTGRSGRRSSR